MSRAFAATDMYVLERGQVGGWGDGTTAVVAMLVNRSVYVANAGDSRAVLLVPRAESPPASADSEFGAPSGAAAAAASLSGGSGADEQYTFVVLSRPHSPQLEEERRRVEASGGCVVRGRVNGELAVSRALGDARFKRFGVSALPDVMSAVFAEDGSAPQQSSGSSVDPVFGTPIVVGPMPTAERPAVLLLGCDGFWEHVTHRQIASVLRAELGGAPSDAAAQRAAQALVKCALESGSMDNVTVVAVLLYAQTLC
jgi:serine/threonine protein phosphatase PrpC